MRTWAKNRFMKSRKKKHAAQYPNDHQELWDSGMYGIEELNFTLWWNKMKRRLLLARDITGWISAVIAAVASVIALFK